MKSWDDLTESGRMRRLRPLAGEALRNYAITPQRLSLVGGFTNAIFRVDAAEGTYAIRIDYLEEHPDESTAVELAWLTALAEETSLDVCRVVAARTGAQSVYAAAAGVPGARRCVLFEWIPGVPLADRLTPQRYEQLGELSALLHQHGARFEPPVRPMAWDKVFYWPAELDPYVIDAPEHSRHFAGGRMSILERSVATVERAFDRLDRAGAQIVHGDLHPWNVHVMRSRMIALDFEDVLWAHPVQDIATTLFYKRTEPNYSALRAAFEQGYRSVRTWPETYDGEIEHFMAARTLSFVNFVLNLGGDEVEFLDSAFPRLERFLGEYEA